MTLPPGLRLMRSTTCLAPAHYLVADTGASGRPCLSGLISGSVYLGDASARETLAQKIITGGIGVWGKEVPMPPHPQHTIDQTRQMVDWVLSLAADSTPPPRHGLTGTITTPMEDNNPHAAPPVVLLTASYTDNGAASVPPLRGETVTVLHPHRKKASLFDAMKSAEVVDVFEGQEGNVLRLQADGWFRFDTMDLAGITHITCHVAPLATGAFQLEAHLDAPDGRLLGSERINCMTEKDEGFGEFTMPIAAASAGPHAVYFVARFAPQPPNAKTVLPPPGGRILDVNWVEFRDNPLPAWERAPIDGQPRAKILFVTTKLDHPWQAHMYSAVTEMLAAEMNKQPDIEAIISPDFGWPRDEKIFDGIKGIVYYSGSAGELIIGQHGEAFAKLMQQGIGFTALHFATGASKLVGDRYAEFTGGWWTLQPDSLAIGPVEWKFLTRRPSYHLHGVQADHDERRNLPRTRRIFYESVPLIQVHIKDRDDVVAWAYERPGGGRSFATTLGHPWANWQNETFRHLVFNGIRWTVGLGDTPAPQPSPKSK